MADPELGERIGWSKIKYKRKYCNNFQIWGECQVYKENPNNCKFWKRCSLCDEQDHGRRECGKLQAPESKWA